MASPAANSAPHNPKNFISASLQAETVELSPARLHLATSKVRDKSTASFQACTRQVRYTPNC